MNIESTNLVTPDDLRPGIKGSSNQCGYCTSILGDPHQPECVCLKKIVVVEMTMQIQMEFPRSFDQDNIEFRLNESTYCTDSAIDGLHRWTEEQEQKKNQYGGSRCSCPVTQFKYLRDATEKDVDDLPSA